MKLFKLMPVMLAILLMVACGKDDDEGGDKITDPVAPVLTAPDDGTTIVVSDDNLSTEVAFTWEEAEFGANVAVAYTVQADIEGGSFTNPAILSTGVTGTSSAVSYSSLNSAAISDLSQAVNAETSLDVRVVASSTGFEDLISNVIGIDLTTYQSITQDPAVISNLAVSSAVLTNESLDTDFVIEWSAADFGSEDPITYLLKMAVSGDGVAQSIQVAKTTELTYTLTHEALNFYIDQNLAQDANTEVEIDFFVTAQSGVASLDSDAKTATFTTIDATFPEGSIYMTGSFTNPAWEPWNNPQVLGVEVAVEDSTAQESFWYFDDVHDVKFTDQRGWDGNNYAYESEGVLTTVGTDNIPVSAGHYRVTVDDDGLYYAFDQADWGIIGSATPGGWDSSTAMTYNTGTNTWEITTDLVNGALKFRANDAWDINLGPRDSFTHRGELVHTDGAVDFGVGTDGNYTIKVSFDTSVSPYKWNFEVIKN